MRDPHARAPAKDETDPTVVIVNLGRSVARSSPATDTVREAASGQWRHMGLSGGPRSLELLENSTVLIGVARGKVIGVFGIREVAVDGEFVSFELDQSLDGLGGDWGETLTNLVGHEAPPVARWRRGELWPWRTLRASQLFSVTPEEPTPIGVSDVDPFEVRRVSPSLLIVVAPPGATVTVHVRTTDIESG